MPQIRSNLRKRSQNKSTKMRSRMRNFQMGKIYRLLSEKEQINVNKPRTVSYRLLAPHLRFYSFEDAQSLFRIERCRSLNHLIEKPRLILKTDRLRLIYR